MTKNNISLNDPEDKAKLLYGYEQINNFIQASQKLLDALDGLHECNVDISEGWLEAFGASLDDWMALKLKNWTTNAKNAIAKEIVLIELNNKEEGSEHENAKTIIPKEYEYPYEVFKKSFPQYNGNEALFDQAFVTFGYDNEESFLRDHHNSNEYIFIEGCIFSRKVIIQLDRI